MLNSRRASLWLCVSALAWSGCNIPDWVKDILHGHGGGHHGGGHHGGDCDGDDAGDDAGVACSSEQYTGADGACHRKVTSVSAGIGYTCAILAGGDLKCWGGDSWYRLGYGAPGGNLGDAPGELGDALPAIPIDATKVFADSDVTCAILASGGAKCWGYNGYGTATGIPVPSQVDDTVDLLPTRTFTGGRTAVDIAAGSGTAYAALDDGSAVTWGMNVSDTSFGAGRVVVALARGTLYDNWHMCALLADGAIACKGFGLAGQLGRDPSGDPLVMPPGGYALVDLGTGRTASAVVAGDSHTCALRDGGDVVCWGANGYGQLGRGDTANRGLLPGEMGDNLVPVPLGQPATAIAAGRNHTCALLADGSVKCWGRNDAGQLGVGATDNRGDAPGEVAALAPIPLGTGRTAVALDAGGHSCAVLDDGSLKCWGENAGGQLGQGDTNARGDAPGELGDALPAIDLGS